MMLLNIEFDLEDYVDVVDENLRHWTNIKLSMYVEEFKSYLFRTLNGSATKPLAR